MVQYVHCSVNCFIRRWCVFVCVCVCKRQTHRQTERSFPYYHSLVLLDSCFSVGGVCPREKTNRSISVLWGSHILSVAPSFTYTRVWWHVEKWTSCLQFSHGIATDRFTSQNPISLSWEHQEIVLSPTKCQRKHLFWSKSVIIPKHSLCLSLYLTFIASLRNRRDRLYHQQNKKREGRLWKEIRSRSSSIGEFTVQGLWIIFKILLEVSIGWMMINI